MTLTWPPPDCGLTLDQRCPHNQIGDRQIGFPCRHHRHGRCSGFTGGYDDALYTCACRCHRAEPNLCHVCNGAGVVDDYAGDVPCVRCNGTGRADCK